MDLTRISFLSLSVLCLQSDDSNKDKDKDKDHDDDDYSDDSTMIAMMMNGHLPQMKVVPATMPKTLDILNARVLLADSRIIPSSGQGQGQGSQQQRQRKNGSGSHPPKRNSGD